MSKKIMEEDIPLEDLPKGNDDDDDYDWDDTTFQTQNTSTSHIEYPGYDEDEGIRRAEWDMPSERRNLGDFLRERDEEYDRRGEAGQEIKRYFPDFNPREASFNVEFEEDGSIIGKLSDRKNAAAHIILDKDKNLKIEDLPKVMRKELGVDYETMLKKYNNTASELRKSIEKNKDLDSALQGLDSASKTHPQEIAQYEERVRRLTLVIESQKAEKENMERDSSEGKRLFDKTAKQNIELKIQQDKILEELKLCKEEIDKYKKGESNLTKLEQINDRLKSEVEKLREQIRNKTISDIEQLSDIDGRKDEILKNLPLRERIKYLFKKYGFTVFAVVSAAGAIIGVIVSNLSKGLTKLGKGVGNGLKAIGKKLGEILPGMVGAIVSFLFKTAGQVIGFLGENAWLLIMAAVLYFVESMKKKRK